MFGETALKLLSHGQLVFLPLPNTPWVGLGGTQPSVSRGATAHASRRYRLAKPSTVQNPERPALGKATTREPSPEQLPNRYAERVRDLEQAADGRVPQPSLDPGHVRAVQVCGLGKLFLGPVPFVPKLADSPAQRFQDARLGLRQSPCWA